MGETYSVELWFWNGLPNEVRPIAGYLVSRRSHATGDQLGIGGTQVAPRRLFFSTGNNNTNKTLAGKTEIVPKTWHHVALVRERGQVTVYLDGNRQPEIVGAAGVWTPSRIPRPCSSAAGTTASPTSRGRSTKSPFTTGPSQPTSSSRTTARRKTREFLTYSRHSLAFVLSTTVRTTREPDE